MTPTQIEAIRDAAAALERLDGWLKLRHLGGLMPQEAATLAALNAALARPAPVQEPVGCPVPDCDGTLTQMTGTDVYRCQECGGTFSADAVSKPAPVQEPTVSSGEQAPPHSLPVWSECAMRVDNSNFYAKSIADGGYGPEHDSKLASALHRFIYEYDDKDPYRSAWFMHRLENMINEISKQPAPPADVPMLTEEEILSAYCANPSERQYVTVFFAGAKWAEKTLRQKAGLP